MGRRKRMGRRRRTMGRRRRERGEGGGDAIPMLDWELA